MQKLLLVVEGHGEVTAAKTLGRRVLHANGIYGCHLEVQRRTGLVQLASQDWQNLDRFLEAAYKENAPILWMLDCDDGCALEWIVKIYDHLKAKPLRQPLAFVLWVREYEVLFLYDWSSVVNKIGASELDRVDHPETIRGVKGFISRHLPDGEIYKEMMHQDMLTAVANMDNLRKNPDFSHFERVLLWLKENCCQPKLYPFSDGR